MMTAKKNAPTGQPYELFMFASKHRLSVDVAREIIDRHGADRVAADAEARLASQARGTEEPQPHFRIVPQGRSK